MRSNLLSLQNISGQVSSTQNKLATGNKVNSAIDNPSSYYTALSLNNRADDLNALLDSMGQAVNTIKAATTALESATEFLEQAKAVANQALESAKVPDKAFFEEKVGENGAVVTTAQELRDAVNSGKETICVYGAIDLGDISTQTGLELKENQKLVGVGYFGNFADNFSSISSVSSSAQNMITINQDNCLISDLNIEYDDEATSGTSRVIYVSGNDVTATLCNLDIYSNKSQNNDVRAIYLYNGDAINIDGNINIKSGRGIESFNFDINISSNAKINIQTSTANGYGISAISDSECNIGHGAEINIETLGTASYGVNLGTNSTFNIEGKAKINIKTLSSSSFGINVYGSSVFNSFTDTNITINSLSYGLRADSSIINLSGNIVIDANSFGISNTGENSIVNIFSSARTYFNTKSSEIINGSTASGNSNIVSVSKGAKLAFEKDGQTKWYEVKKDWKDENASTTTDNKIAADNIKDKLTVEETSAWELPEKVEIDWEDSNSSGETAKQDLADAGKNYQEIINQYDSLIKDASYKGINLLQADKLTVKFNETNTADLSVQGKDMSSQALGFTVFGWETQGDIADSLAEIANALQSIRNYSSELGNNYSIITTRQDFTESLINVLTEGADKLTLADMNEESANMLALQTRQQLAINSLSLASQASQSILKLF